MRYQRLHIRVPAAGEVYLTVQEQVRVRAEIIDVSVGGLRMTAPSEPVEKREYLVQVVTPAHGSIEFSGIPVYQTGASIGMKITAIDKNHLKTVYQMVESFQITEEFIKYIDESTVIHEWLVDESGDKISVTFETDN